MMYSIQYTHIVAENQKVGNAQEEILVCVPDSHKLQPLPPTHTHSCSVSMWGPIYFYRLSGDVCVGWLTPQNKILICLPGTRFCTIHKKCD